MTELRLLRITSDIKKEGFNCGVESINQEVFQSFYPSLLQHVYAYSINAEGKVLGYYMVGFREVKLENFGEDIADYCTDFKKTISAVHINYIAINVIYQRHKIGTEVLRAIIKQVKALAEKWPVRVITIDAVEHLVDWYKNEGFVEMKKNTPGQDGVSKYMYYDCIINEKEFRDYLEMT